MIKIGSILEKYLKNLLSTLSQIPSDKKESRFIFMILLGEHPFPLPGALAYQIANQLLTPSAAGIMEGRFTLFVSQTEFRPRLDQQLRRLQVGVQAGEMQGRFQQGVPLTGVVTRF